MNNVHLQRRRGGQNHLCNRRVPTEPGSGRGQAGPERLGCPSCPRAKVASSCGRRFRDERGRRPTQRRVGCNSWHKPSPTDASKVLCHRLPQVSEPEYCLLLRLVRPGGPPWHTHQTVRASRREGVVRFLRAGSSRPHEKALRQCQASPARGRAKPGGRGGGSIGSLAIAFVMLMLVFCREAVTGIETDEIYIPFVRKMEQP